jgi:hypothetical protein
MPFLLPLLIVAGIPPVSNEFPNRQPQLAAAHHTVALVYGSGHTVMFASSKDDGRTFSKPAPVAELPGLMLGRHRGPRVAIAGSALVVSAIASKPMAAGEHAHGAAADGNLLAWRSTDGGKTWSKGVVVNDEPAAAREGLHAMAADEQGHVAAVWLDLRAKGTRLYGAFSNDAGATWSKNMLVYQAPGGTICQCCHPSLAALGNGEFAVMFRNAEGGNRDMYLLRIRAGEVLSAAAKLGHGTWQLNACPMDGGGLAAGEGKMLTAWRRGEEVFLAQPGEAEQRLGAGKDVALAAQGGKTVAIWSHAGAIEAWTSGRTESLSKNGAFPVAAGLSEGGILAAWEENGGIALRLLQ